MPIKTEISLTQEEKDYIAKAGVIKAVSIEGAAPIQYIDANGETRGISKGALSIISDMTGLIFDYKIYDSRDELISNYFDIIVYRPDIQKRCT